VVWSPDFDESFDRFWADLQRQHQDVLLAVRDRATLMWHYQPGGTRQNTWLATIRKGSSLRAYAIFIRRDHAGSGLRRVRLVDFQALDDTPEAFSSILASTLMRCRAEGIHMLEDIGCLAERLGCPAPHQRRLEAWAYYYRALPGGLTEALRDPARWAPTSFEGDLSL
jgi:hypothetical protein